MEKTQKNTLKKGGDIGKIIKVSLNSSSCSRVLDEVSRRLQVQKRIFIITPNPEFLVFAFDNPWFREILGKANMSIPDGVAFFWAQEVNKGNNILTRLIIGFSTGLKVIFSGWGKKRVTGTDLVGFLCKMASEKEKTVYFLGGQHGVAKEALKALQKKHPSLKGWAETGPKLNINEIKASNNKIRELVAGINQKEPDFLFVALGMGKQEKFIWGNWLNLDVKLAVGIGGAFDYLGGRVKRAPGWIRDAGCEWLYRLMKQPWRFSRQLSLLKFIVLIIKGNFK